MRFLRASDRQPVTIHSTATLGVGGEARIYAVAGAPELAAKIYHHPRPGHAAKLTAMLSNRPEDPSASQGHVSIAWPSDLLLAGNGNDRVLGFLMPRVEEMHPIIDFYHPKTRRRKHPRWTYLCLLRTARNLAACVNALHARGYVIGDLNESNILVSDTALVTLVDTDSFQVPDTAQGCVHRCRVGKLEFTPPELQSIRFEWVDRQPANDLFGLAVLFFQLLMEGIHPFAGRHSGRGEPPSLEERIHTGSFPYAPGGPHRIRPMPTAPPFELLAPAVRDLFSLCFVQGHTDPSQRPSAEAWQHALLAAEDSLVSCPANAQHLYGNHLDSCPWCERRQLFRGRDSFPFVRSQKPLRSAVFDPGTTSLKRTVDYETAIAIAEQAIHRQKHERIVKIVLLVLILLGLVAFLLSTLSSRQA